MKEGGCCAVTNGIKRNVLQTASVGLLLFQGARKSFPLKLIDSRWSNYVSSRRGQFRRSSRFKQDPSEVIFASCRLKFTQRVLHVLYLASQPFIFFSFSLLGLFFWQPLEGGRRKFTVHVKQLCPEHSSRGDTAAFVLIAIHTKFFLGTKVKTSVLMMKCWCCSMYVPWGWTYNVKSLKPLNVFAQTVNT